MLFALHFQHRLQVLYRCDFEVFGSLIKFSRFVIHYHITLSKINTTQLFGRTPDPDFAEASLLEQYQAQIGSALTPAFAADSSPELAAEAVNVCATFIATGIVTDIDRMGRILKLLVSALENFSGR